MSTKWTLFLTRAIGTFLGLMGVFMIVALATIAVSPRMDSNLSWIPMILIPLLLAGFMIYIGFNVWHNLTPKLVNQLCGLLWFMIWGGINRLVKRHTSVEELYPELITGLGSILLCYVGFWLTSRLLRRSLTLGATG